MHVIRFDSSPTGYVLQIYINNLHVWYLPESNPGYKTLIVTVLGVASIQSKLDL